MGWPGRYAHGHPAQVEVVLMLAATAVRCLGLLPPARENTEGGRNGQTLTATLRGRLGRVVFRTGSKCSACAGSLQASSLGRKAHRPRRPRRAAADVSPFPPPLVASPAGGSSPRHRTAVAWSTSTFALTWSVPRADRPCLGCSSRPQRPPSAAGTVRHRLQHAVDAHDEEQSAPLQARHMRARQRPLLLDDMLTAQTASTACCSRCLAVPAAFGGL